MSNMVYVSSPMSAETADKVEANLEFARRASRYCALCGRIPVTPHLYFTQFLREEVKTERLLGQKMGQCIMPSCSEVWVCGDTVSDGMRAEIALARKLDIPVVEVSSKDIAVFLESCGDRVTDAETLVS